MLADEKELRNNSALKKDLKKLFELKVSGQGRHEPFIVSLICYTLFRFVIEQAIKKESANADSYIFPILELLSAYQDTVHFY